MTVQAPLNPPGGLGAFVNTTGVLGSLFLFLLCVGIAATLNLVVIPRMKKGDPDSAPEAFRNPHWKIVRNHSYTNEMVEMDGVSFRDCSFVNTKLMYRGNAPTELVGISRFGKSVILVTDNPALDLYTKLTQLITSAPGAEIRDGSDGPSYRKKIVDSGEQFGPLFFSPLQVRAFNIAKELQQFKNNFEPCPILSPLDGTDESFEKKIHDKRVLLEPWQERLGHAYVSMFSRRVTDLVHELGAKGFDVSGLEPYSKWVGSMDNVSNAIKALWKLAEDMEKPVKAGG